MTKIESCWKSKKRYDEIIMTTNDKIIHRVSLSPGLSTAAANKTIDFGIAGFGFPCFSFKKFSVLEPTSSRLSLSVTPSHQHRV